MKTKFLFLIMIIASHIGYSQIFYDDVSGETMGDFPSKWDVITGMATVEAIEGFNTISLVHGSIIKPIVNDQTNHYINGDFTIEFDAFFGKTSSIYGQRIIVRLWNGKYSHKQGNIRYNPFIIKRNGISTSWLQPESGKADIFFKDLHTLEPIWRHVKIACKNSKLKIFLDNKLILNLPRFKMQPTMVSIGGAINDSKYDAKVGIANFKVVSNQKQTRIAMIMDRKTNKVIDINLVTNLQKTPNLKSVYPNTTIYLGTIQGNHELRPVEFSDVKKPQLIDINTYGKYTILPEKEAQMVFNFEKEFITENLNFNSIQQYSFDTSSNILKGDYFETNTILKTPTKNLTLKDNLLYLFPNHNKTSIGETDKNLSINSSINNSNITTPIISNPTPNIEENIITSSQENNNSKTNSGVINQIKFNRNISDEAHQKMEELLPKGIQSFSFSPNGGWVIITKDNKHFARNIPQKCYEKIKEYINRGIKIKEVVFPPNGGNNSWIIITENDTYARNIPQECYEKIQSFKQQGKTIESVSFPYKNIFNDSDNAWVILTTDGQFYTRNIPDECYQIMRNIRQTDMPNKPSDRKISKVSFTPSGGWTVIADDYFFSRNIPEEAFKKLGEFRGKGYNNSILAFDPDKNGWSVIANKRVKNIPSNKIRDFERNIDSSKSIWKIMRERKIPGVSVAVVINGKIAWKTSYGHLIANDKRYAVHPESMFQAASISKVFAAVGAFKLIDDNKVTLTENLLTSGKLKSNIPFNSCVKDSSWVQNFNEVTIENILQHRSGIEGRGSQFNSNCSYKGSEKGGGYGGYENLHSLPNLDTLLKDITITYHPTKMISPPNNKSNWYSGKAFTVLQKLTEDITSNNYPSWMKSNILGPLGMNKSGFVINPENKYGEFSRAHNKKGEKVKVLRFPQYAAAGLYTSSEELANLIIMINNNGIFQGNRILSKNAIFNLVDNHMGVNTRANRYSHGGTNSGGFKALFTGIRNINKDGIKNAGIVVLTNGTDQYVDLNNDKINDFVELRYLITNRIRITYGW
ncbi:serine hydrolase domain-containing protein [Tenacibaculum sp.]|uniref:serine hydrolase domain-containing protein n=1 Tax=Tenacibaculum sp. TaxID=1906242 RepID=UPI003AA98CFD